MELSSVEAKARIQRGRLVSRIMPTTLPNRWCSVNAVGWINMVEARGVEPLPKEVSFKVPFIVYKVTNNQRVAKSEQIEIIPKITV